MSLIPSHIAGIEELFPEVTHDAPWQIPPMLAAYLESVIPTLPETYHVEGNVALHQHATVEQGVILKGPILIHENCFVGAHAYLRGGVLLGAHTRIGPGCEIKSSLIGGNSSIAHFNFIGDSLIGNDVNMEAGALTANHYNERMDKRIFVCIDGLPIDTGCTKFGALIGDRSRIGANAVLSPGTILPPDSVVKRLELVEQNPE